MTDLETLLRAAGDALDVPVGPLPDLSGRLAERRSFADLDHLHLKVRDLEASAAFYQRWFGLQGEVVEGTLFARNREGFLLCLTSAADARPLVDVHFGFTMRSGTAVRELHADMSGAGIAVNDLYEDATFASFRAADPDGNTIEVFWE
jgi:catechol 2,3-dioxygenase-like lactoylglutathione lyase family enzyme